ncbi:MAG: GNAT family protein [Patescibacteria group bacterium]
MTTFLENRRIRLRPVEEKDLPTLYMWRNEFDFLSLFSPHRNIINYEKFVVEHKRDTDKSRHIQFVVESIRGNAAVGIAYSYNLSTTDGYVFLGGYIAKTSRGNGYGAIAMAMVISYLFQFFPLHKIYFEVYEYNEQSISMLQNFGFVEEGRFKGHRFYDGKRHDVLRFALYRDELDKVKSLLSRISRTLYKDLARM